MNWAIGWRPAGGANSLCGKYCLGAALHHPAIRNVHKSLGKGWAKKQVVVQDYDYGIMFSKSKGRNWVGQKLKFVLSDLHIGAGHANAGGNPLEDFKADAFLVDFLHTIWHESEDQQREIELIINGDLFEFLQVPAVDDYDPAAVYPPELYADSCEAASVKRLNIIVKGHPEVFNALSDFMHVEHPQRRITIIKGNRDVHLFWPGVKNRLREILGASGTRASLLRFANDFISREKIYIEHGHQRAEAINGYPDSYDSRAPDNPGQLYYPIGSRFALDFINRVEAERWFVDNIKPINSLIWYALSQNFNFAADALVSFIQCTTDNTGPVPAEVAGHNLNDEAQRRDAAQKYATDAAFRQEFHRHVQQLFHQKSNADASLRPDISDDPAVMGRAYQIRQQSLLRRAAEDIANREGARVILFGHTHHPIQETLGSGALYINTGSWIENFFDVPLETWEALFEGLHSAGHTPFCLPYARIEYDANQVPSAQLLYFNQAQQADADAISEKSFFEKNFHWLSRLLKSGS